MSIPDVTSPRCLRCGFEAPAGDRAWDRVKVPPLRTMTQCPECGSTNIISQRYETAAEECSGREHHSPVHYQPSLRETTAMMHRFVEANDSR